MPAGSVFCFLVHSHKATQHFRSRCASILAERAEEWWFSFSSAFSPLLDDTSHFLASVV